MMGVQTTGGGGGADGTAPPPPSGFSGSTGGSSISASPSSHGASVGGPSGPGGSPASGSSPSESSPLPSPGTPAPPSLPGGRGCGPVPISGVFSGPASSKSRLAKRSNRSAFAHAWSWPISAERASSPASVRPMELRTGRPSMCCVMSFILHPESGMIKGRLIGLRPDRRLKRRPALNSVPHDAPPTVRVHRRCSMHGRGRLQRPPAHGAGTVGKGRPRCAGRGDDGPGDRA